MKSRQEGYKVGDSVVYPMHGAGVIESIEERSVLGRKQSYYVMRMPIGGMTVMIPTNSINEVGLRDVITASQAKKLLEEFGDIDYQFIDNVPWSKRYRENMELIKTGDILDIAKVVKSLMVRDSIKGLCTAEKKMLSSVKKMLLSELILSKVGTYEEIEDFISQIIVKKTSAQGTDSQIASV